MRKELLYGFFSKDMLLANGEDGYGCVYLDANGNHVLVNEVCSDPNPFNKYGDNIHCGVVIEYLRKATFKDVEGHLPSKPRFINHL